MQKTVVYSTDADAARRVAACLGVSVATEGMVACGTPLGQQSFIEAHVQRRCDRTIGLVDDLLEESPDAWIRCPPNRQDASAGGGERAIVGLAPGCSSLPDPNA